MLSIAIVVPATAFHLRSYILEAPMNIFIFSTILQSFISIISSFISLIFALLPPVRPSAQATQNRLPSYFLRFVSLAIMAESKRNQDQAFDVQITPSPTAQQSASIDDFGGAKPMKEANNPAKRRRPGGQQSLEPPPKLPSLYYTILEHHKNPPPPIEKPGRLTKRQVEEKYRNMGYVKPAGEKTWVPPPAQKTGLFALIDDKAFEKLTSSGPFSAAGPSSVPPPLSAPAPAPSPFPAPPPAPAKKKSLADAAPLGGAERPPSPPARFKGVFDSVMAPSLVIVPPTPPPPPPPSGPDLMHLLTQGQSSRPPQMPYLQGPPRPAQAHHSMPPGFGGPMRSPQEYRDE